MALISIGRSNVQLYMYMYKLGNEAETQYMYKLGNEAETQYMYKLGNEAETQYMSCSISV